MIEFHDIVSLSAATVALVIALSTWLKRSGASDNELLALRREFEAHQVTTDRRHEEMAEQLQNTRLRMAEAFVTKSDLAAMEARVIQHINLVLSAIGCPQGMPKTRYKANPNGEENGSDH